MTALAPHPHRAPEVRRAAPFGPNLFASAMGTGIVATAGASLPGLHAFATVVWALDAAVLVVLVVAAVRSWTPAAVRDQFAELAELGFDFSVLTFPRFQELDDIKLFVDEVMPAFA